VHIEGNARILLLKFPVTWAHRKTLEALSLSGWWMRCVDVENNGLEGFDVFKLESSSAAATRSFEPKDGFPVICRPIVHSGIDFPVAV
jgi:hypothetical protein